MAEDFISRHLSPDYIAVHWRLEWARIMQDSSLRTVLDTEEVYDDCWNSLVRAVKYGPHGLTTTGAALGGGTRPSQQLGRQQQAPGSGTPDSSCGSTIITANLSSSGSGDGSSSGSLSCMDDNGSEGRVFLAADMSPQEVLSSSISNTMDDQAKEIARKALKKVLESLEVVTWPSHEPWFLGIESGVQGILDKLVAMKAGFFLGAAPECGGAHTYTEEIHAYRAERQLPSDTWVYERE